MDSRKFARKVHYTGQERAARKLLLEKGKLSAEAIAMMTDVDIYSEILQDYEVAACEDESILLICKEDMPTFNKMAVYLER